MHDRDDKTEDISSPEHKRRSLTPSDSTSTTILANCKNEHPEDFEYVKEIINERLPKGVSSSGIIIPEDWDDDHKERVSNLLVQLGFERLARDPFRFKAPKKKTLLSPLKMIITESEDELISSFNTLKLEGKRTQSTMHRHGKKRKDSDPEAHDESHLHTQTPFKITAIQIGETFSVEKDENTELDMIIDYHSEIILFDVCEFVTKKRIEILFSNIKTVERDFGTCLTFVIKDVAKLEYLKETPDKNWEKIEDFTKGALESFPFIKVQFAIKKTFDKHWTHLQHILRNTDLENHITKFYKLTTLIGRGSFSEIRIGINIKEKKEYAIKIVDKKHLQSDMLKQVRDEYELVRQLHHKNIIEMKESYETDDTLYIVMEYCKGGDLFDYITNKTEGNFTEQETRIIMKQLLSAVEFIHQHHYIHRDIKLENVVLTDPSTLSIKLIDFGIAKIMKRKTTRTFVGTPLYLAPEIIETNLGHTDGYTDACDLWACGVIMYILLRGEPPFDADSKHPNLASQIKQGSYSLSGHHWKSISDECKDLLKSLLCVSAKERITATKALKHEWFKKEL